MFISNHTSTNENYTLSLHDALPISLIGDINTTDSKDTLAILPLATREATPSAAWSICATTQPAVISPCRLASLRVGRSEEHTSELQSRPHLVCRLLLEKKKLRACRS